MNGRQKITAEHLRRRAVIYLRQSSERQVRQNIEDLAARLERGPLDAAEAVRLLRRVCTALSAVHRQGVVHRDIKPSNLFLVGGDAQRAQVIDFGIARSAQATRVLTDTGALLGTVGYMAPEQALGQPDIDSRADVFSLGCVLFECLAGRPAFEGEHAVAILAQILAGQQPRLREAADGVPPALEALVTAMLRHERDERPPDAQAVLEALEALEIREAGARGAAPPSGDGGTLSTAEQRYVCVLLVTRPDAPVDLAERRYP